MTEHRSPSCYLNTPSESSPETAIRHTEQGAKRQSTRNRLQNNEVRMNEHERWTYKVSDCVGLCRIAIRLRLWRDPTIWINDRVLISVVSPRKHFRVLGIANSLNCMEYSTVTCTRCNERNLKRITTSCCAACYGFIAHRSIRRYRWIAFLTRRLKCVFTKRTPPTDGRIGQMNCGYAMA